MEFTFRRKGSYRSLSVFVGPPQTFPFLPKGASVRPPTDAKARIASIRFEIILRIFLVLIRNLGRLRIPGTFLWVQNRLFSMALSCTCFNSAENQSCKIVVYSLLQSCYCCRRRRRRRRCCCWSPIMSKFRSS